MLMGSIALRRGTGSESPGRVGRRKMGHDKLQETRPVPISPIIQVAPNFLGLMYYCGACVLL